MKFHHPYQTATVVRPSVSGDPREDPETDLGECYGAAEDITTEVRQEPGGQNVKFAVRWWTEDPAVYRPKDVFTIEWLEQTESLVVEDPRRYPDHQQIRLVSRLGSDEGGAP